MSQESASQLAESIPELRDQRLSNMINMIDGDDNCSDNVNDKRKTIPSYLKTSGNTVIGNMRGENTYNMTFNLDALSNSHTPLLSSENNTEKENDDIPTLKHTINVNVKNFDGKYHYEENVENVDNNENNENNETNENNENHKTDTVNAIDDNNDVDNDYSNENTANMIKIDNDRTDSNYKPCYKPYEILQLRREEYKSINIEPQSGLNFYYIDKSWLNIFLDYDFDENDISIEQKIGPVKTVEINSKIENSEENFIVLDQFKLLIQWFQLEQDNQIVERNMVYSNIEKKLIIDLEPLTIIPHIFCNSPAQVNRYNQKQNRNHEFQISSHRPVADLLKCMKSYFELEKVDTSSLRLWCVEFESLHTPTVIIPSTLKFIKHKKQISKKKKKYMTLYQRQISSCHIMLQLKQNDDVFFLDIESHVIPGSGLLGLNNLGNTCYMNSALQCLAHIPELNSYFLYHFFENELNKDNPLGNNGKVAMSFGSLIASLFDNRYAANQSSFSPREFKYTIGHFNSLFADYHQQDSQEFIAYLLDGLHEDLNRVLKKPYVEKPELEAGKENDPDEIKLLAQKCWDAHKMRNDSVIVDLFVALYKSTLICPVCDQVSISFDPYNDLTLPLPSTKKWSHKINILPEEGYPKVLEIQINKSSSYRDLKKSVSRYMNIPENELIGVEIMRNSIYKNFEDPLSDSRYLPISELINSGDDIWFYQIKKNPDDIILPVFSTVFSNDNRTNFGLPFLITFSPEERKSYGMIQKKLIKKYKQLSTSSLFEKLDEAKFGNYSKADFDGIELFFRQFDNTSDEIENLDSANDEDEMESIISFASPDVSVEDTFRILTFDASMDRSYFNRRFQYNTSINNDTQTDQCMWFPANHNTITRDDLPILIDKLSPKKKCFYYYQPNHLKTLKEIQANIDIRAKEENRSDDAFVSDDSKSLNGEDITNDSHLVAENEKQYDSDSKCEIEHTVADNNQAENQLVTELNNDFTNDLGEEKCESDDPYYTATESLTTSTVDLTANHGPLPLFQEPEKKTLSPSVTEPLTPSDGASPCELSPSLSPSHSSPSPSPSPSVVPPQHTNSYVSVSSSRSTSSNNDENEADELMQEATHFLIEPMNAIVCEFSEYSFDLCFCNNDDGEYSGAETWSSPELLVNSELELEKKANAENLKRPITLYDCLELFSKPEILGQNDLWYCPKCKEHREATKKIELWSAPDILTIHLKRFESTRSFSDKIDVIVDFPIEGLDLTKYVADKDGEHIYDLFAVDNHYGGLGGGHYTAYTKNFVDGKWYYYDDSRVSPVTDPTDSIRGSAYLLFYRKRTQSTLGGEFFNNMMEEIRKKQSDLFRAIEERKVEQISNASVSEISDEEMTMFENKEESKSDNINGSRNDVEGSFEAVSDSNKSIKNYGSNEDAETATDDANKRRKLEHNPSLAESVDISLTKESGILPE